MIGLWLGFKLGFEVFKIGGAGNIGGSVDGCTVVGTIGGMIGYWLGKLGVGMTFGEKFGRLVNGVIVLGTGALVG